MDALRIGCLCLAVLAAMEMEAASRHDVQYIVVRDITRTQPTGVRIVTLAGRTRELH
jgi:hypothetical protein